MWRDVVTPRAVCVLALVVAVACCSLASTSAQPCVVDVNMNCSTCTQCNGYYCRGANTCTVDVPISCPVNPINEESNCPENFCPRTLDCGDCVSYENDCIGFWCASNNHQPCSEKLPSNCSGPVVEVASNCPKSCTDILDCDSCVSANGTLDNCDGGFYCPTSELFPCTTQPPSDCYESTVIPPRGSCRSKTGAACSNLTVCQSCTDAECYWCEDKGVCTDKASGGCLSGGFVVANPNLCPNPVPPPPPLSCSELPSCETCVRGGFPDTDFCLWCPGDGVCIEGMQSPCPSGQSFVVSNCNNDFPNSMGWVQCPRSQSRVDISVPIGCVGALCAVVATALFTIRKWGQLRDIPGNEIGRRHRRIVHNRLYITMFGTFSLAVVSLSTGFVSMMTSLIIFGYAALILFQNWFDERCGTKLGKVPIDREHRLLSMIFVGAVLAAFAGRQVYIWSAWPRCQGYMSEAEGLITPFEMTTATACAVAYAVLCVGILSSLRDPRGVWEQRDALSKYGVQRPTLFVLSFFAQQLFVPILCLATVVESVKGVVMESNSEIFFGIGVLALSRYGVNEAAVFLFNVELAEGADTTQPYTDPLDRERHTRLLMAVSPAGTAAFASFDGFMLVLAMVFQVALFNAHSFGDFIGDGRNASTQRISNVISSVNLVVAMIVTFATSLSLSRKRGEKRATSTPSNFLQLPRWQHLKYWFTKSWRGTQTLVTVNASITMIVYAVGVSTIHAVDVRTYACIIILISACLVLSSVYSHIVDANTHFKHLPTDDHFRIASIGKGAMVVLKGQILANSAEHMTVFEIINAIFYFGSFVVVAVMTLVDIRSMWRDRPHTGTRDPVVPRRGTFLVGYCMMYITAKAIGVYIGVVPHLSFGTSGLYSGPFFYNGYVTYGGLFANSLEASMILLGVTFFFLVFSNNEICRFISAYYKSVDMASSERAEGAGGVAAPCDVLPSTRDCRSVDTSIVGVTTFSPFVYMATLGCMAVSCVQLSFLQRNVGYPNKVSFGTCIPVILNMVAFVGSSLLMYSISDRGALGRKYTEFGFNKKQTEMVGVKGFAKDGGVSHSESLQTSLLSNGANGDDD